MLHQGHTDWLRILLVTVYISAVAFLWRGSRRAMAPAFWFSLVWLLIFTCQMRGTVDAKSNKLRLQKNCACTVATANEFRGAWPFENLLDIFQLSPTTFLLAPKYQASNFLCAKMPLEEQSEVIHKGRPRGEGRGYGPMQTKADKGEGVNFYCILPTFFMDDPLTVDQHKRLIYVWKTREKLQSQECSLL